MSEFSRRDILSTAVAAGAVITAHGGSVRGIAAGAQPRSRRRRR
jgi:hypothetical protein